MNSRKAYLSLLLILGMLLAGFPTLVLAAPPSPTGRVLAVSADDEPEEVEFTGTVVAIDEAAATFQVEVETEDGETVVYTVVVGEDFDFTTIAVGDLVEVEGTFDETGVVQAEKVVNETEDEEDEDEESFFCVTPDASHPVGQALADKYGVDYAEVMAWFCDGHYGFGQIMHALKLAELFGEDADVYLARREAGEGWGQIWKDLGVIGNGKPDHAGGPPDHAGGPPDHAGGPPDHAGGPPDHAGGPPDHAGGPPDHAGRPDHAGPPVGRGRP